MPPEEINYIYQNPDQQTVDPNRTKRLIIGFAGLFLFIILVIVVLLALLSNPGIRPELGEVAAQHNEIARVAELGQKNNRASSEVKNASATIQSVSLSSSLQLQTVVDEYHGEPLSDTKLSSEENLAVDEEFSSAEQRNDFNETFIEVMTTLLEGSRQTIIDVGNIAEDDATIRTLQHLLKQNELLTKSL